MWWGVVGGGGSVLVEQEHGVVDGLAHGFGVGSDRAGDQSFLDAALLLVADPVGAFVEEFEQFDHMIGCECPVGLGGGDVLAFGGEEFPGHRDSGP